LIFFGRLVLLNDKAVVWLIWCGLCWVWLRVTGRGAVVVDGGWQQLFWGC